MMPCTISVYEKSDGKTYIGSMNAGLLGRVFGGTVAGRLPSRFRLMPRLRRLALLKVGTECKFTPGEQ